MGFMQWRRRRWVRYGVEACLFVALFLAISTWQKRSLVEGPAPLLRGTTLAGAPFDLSTLRGRPVLVHFWASWCPICKLEEGTIDALAADSRRKDAGHEVITVAMESGDGDEVASHLRQRGLAFPVINDPEGDLARAWGVRGVPATFVIDGDGAIRFREMGYTTQGGLRLRLWWSGAY